MPGYQAGTGADLAFDASGARALLMQAGFPGGRGLPKLTFSFRDTPSDLARARYLQSQWATNADITVELNRMEAQAYAQALDAKDYDLAFGGWSADYPDPQDWFTLTFGCKGAYNKFNYCNPALDQLIARADSGSTLD